MIKLPKIILASASPRRAEILTAVGWEFEKQTADIDESLLENEEPENYVRRLAREKAEAVSKKYRDRIVLGADTTVVIEDKIIGKPADLNEAKTMLKMLSGKWHKVITGIAVVSNGETKSDVQSTKVKFAPLSDAEINFLVEKGAPLDKAGAYAVQAQAALFIEKIKGDYWNVVGLPVNSVYNLIKSVTKKG